jgi:hypothetical protein
LNVNPHIECPCTPIQYCPRYEPKIEKNDLKTIKYCTLEDLNLRDDQTNSLRNEIDKLNVERRKKEKFWQSCFDVVVAQHNKAKKDLAIITLNAQQSQNIF